MKHQFILVYERPDLGGYLSPTAVFFDDMPSARVYINDLPEKTEWHILDRNNGYIVVDSGTKQPKKVKR